MQGLLEIDSLTLQYLSIAILFLSVYWYVNHQLTYWRRRGVQQFDKPNFIFGDFKNGILFRTAPGYHLGEIYKTSPPAPFVGFYICHKPCLLLKDPQIIKQILVTDFKNFSNRHFAGSQQKDSLGMINLFGIKNPAWRYLRRKISPTLAKGKLKQMLPLMIETGKPMMEYLWAEVGFDSRMIDAQEVNYKYTSDLIANVALGTKTDSFFDPYSDYTKSLTDFFHSLKRMVALVTVFFMPELVNLIGSRVLFDSSFVRKVFWDAVETREQSGKTRGDYIDSIIELKNGDQNPLYLFKGDNLLYQSGTFFSGFESSSTSATFTLMELAKNEKCQERARDEIKRVTEKFGWTLKGFNEMKYLDQCIAEGIRLHPSVSTIDRTTAKDYMIPNTDIVIEKGTPIFISLYGLHTDAQYFERPDDYDPERFNINNNVSDAYMPFGQGPRKCVGMKVGILHVKVILSMILSEYGVRQISTSECHLDPRSTFTAAADGVILEFNRLKK